MKTCVKDYSPDSSTKKYSDGNKGKNLGSTKDVHMNNNTLVYMLSCIDFRKFG